MTISMNKRRAITQLHIYATECLRKLPKEERTQAMRGRMQELDLTFDDVWDDLPTHGGGSMQQLLLDKDAPWRVWARTNRKVFQLPADVQEVSYELYDWSGFEPVGSPSSWCASVQQLIAASGGDVGVAKEAIKAGQKQRESGGLTFKGPRSFIAYATDIRSRAVLARKGITVEDERSTEGAEF